MRTADAPSVFWVEHKRSYRAAGGSAHTPWRSPPLSSCTGARDLLQRDARRARLSCLIGAVGWEGARTYQRADFEQHDVSFKVLLTEDFGHLYCLRSPGTCQVQFRGTGTASSQLSLTPRLQRVSHQIQTTGTFPKSRLAVVWQPV